MKRIGGLRDCHPRKRRGFEASLQPGQLRARCDRAPLVPFRFVLGGNPRRGGVGVGVFWGGVARGWVVREAAATGVDTLSLAVAVAVARVVVVMVVEVMEVAKAGVRVAAKVAGWEEVERVVAMVADTVLAAAVKAAVVREEEDQEGAKGAAVRAVARAVVVMVVVAMEVA